MFGFTPGERGKGRGRFDFAPGERSGDVSGFDSSFSVELDQNVSRRFGGRGGVAPSFPPRPDLDRLRRPS